MWLVNFMVNCSALSVAFILSSLAVSLQGVPTCRRTKRI
jgi:hypothetical protein